MRDEAVSWEDRYHSLEKSLEIARKDLEFNKRVIEVLVAVGHVSREKVEQAREIVASLT